MIISGVALRGVTVVDNTMPAPTLYLDALDYTGSGTTWTAEKGSNATLINTPTFVAPSPTYFDFDDATGEYATVPNLGDLNSWTVEAWFRLDAVLGAGDVTAVVCNQYNLVNKLNFSIGTNRAPVNQNICVGFFDGAWRTTTGFAAAADVWYHVVGTYDGSTIRQYVDAVLDTQLSYSGTPQSGGEVRIAARWDSLSVPNDFFPGDVGLVRIWNSALSTSQVQELYNENLERFSNSVVTSNLIGYWDPGLIASYSGTGTTVNNVSGAAPNGTMSNITFTDPYFTYNGTNSQIAIADSAALEPGSGDWTMEAWFRVAAFGSSQVVLGKFDNGGGADDVSYSIRMNTTGSLFAQLGSGSGSGATLFVNSTTYQTVVDTWYQVMYVFTNVATNSLETYINGVSIGSVSHSLASILNSTNPLYLGSYNGGEFPQNFNGSIGITRLYNTVLTAGQVLQNFNANRALYGI
jgi:hypothetical protein